LAVIIATAASKAASYSFGSAYSAIANAVIDAVKPINGLSYAELNFPVASCVKDGLDS